MIFDFWLATLGVLLLFAFGVSIWILFREPERGVSDELTDLAQAMHDLQVTVRKEVEPVLRRFSDALNDLVKKVK